MSFDRATFFDMVRERPFGGALTQQQVDGMNFILDVWESDWAEEDIRWLANALAQAYHETGGAMWPIEEYGKGQGKEYGKPDPKTGQIYYGRGMIQCTWADNYRRADEELGLAGELSCYLHADNMLDPAVSAATMFRGMEEGWFRSSGGTPNTFAKYFNDARNDIFEAREIINGDKHTVPSWANGRSIGQLIEGYHNDFLAALDASWRSDGIPEAIEIVLTVLAPPGVKVVVNVEAQP